jgi:exosortase
MTASRRHVLFGLFTLALAVIAFGPLRRVVAFSLNRGNDDSSHVVLIPFVTAALLFSRRDKILSELRTSLAPALIAFAAGALLYYAGQANAAHLGQSDYFAVTIGGVIVFWLGGFLLFYGLSAFRAGLFPLLFLGLAVPIPSALFHEVARLLQNGSAWMVSAMFAVTGTPAYRSDFKFMLPGLTIEVAEECSGIRSTLGIFIVTLLGSHLLLKTRLRQAALLLAVVPISLFKNALRIVTLTLLAIHWDMGFITGKLHGEGGIVFMMIGLVLMYPFLVYLMRSEEKTLVSGVRS